MDNDGKEYLIFKCDKSLNNCAEYQMLNKEILKLEKNLKSKLSDTDFKSFLEIESLYSKQGIIFIDELLKIC